MSKSDTTYKNPSVDELMNFIRKVKLQGIPPKLMNRKYRMYFDETGNARKFRITDEGFNSDEKEYFILGGLASKKEIPLHKVEYLFDKFKLKESQQEIKFKHITYKAKDFLELLEKPLVQELIDWIFDNNYWIHFQLFDNFYYGIVDIVDSLEIQVTDFNTQRELKTALFNALKANRDETLNIFRKYDYPNVETPKEFLEDILVLIKDYRGSEDYVETLRGGNTYIFEILEHFIQKSMESDLVFLQANIPRLLIDEYYQLYLTRITNFKNSKLIFDHEVEVERHFSEIGVKAKNFKFVDSNPFKAQNEGKYIDEKTHKLVQVSDLIVGVLRMYFKHATLDAGKHFEKLRQVLGINSIQEEYYKKFITILNRSVNENLMFRMYVTDIYRQSDIESYLKPKIFNKKLKNIFAKFEKLGERNE